jgi:hypothetical protein
MLKHTTLIKPSPNPSPQEFPFFLALLRILIFSECLETTACINNSYIEALKT